MLDAWFLENKRSFPWREEATPYRVWVSEVMLQQTRALVVVSYFERWMEQFPTIQALAAAPLERVIKAWEGLGYYSRARNLHAGARHIVEKHGGELPSTKEALLAIPGLGPYTVAAILSFGFKQRAAAVDGNVLRVISRYAWIDEDIGKSSGKRRVEAFANQFLSPDRPWVTAEALIELGATICTPIPRCGECPLQESCLAHLKGNPTALPIKAPPPKVEKIVRGVAIVEAFGRILVRKNPSHQLMGDLWEFPYFEGEQSFLGVQKKLRQKLGLEVEVLRKMEPVAHSFTRFSARLFPFYCKANEWKEVDGYSWILRKELNQLSFSSGHRKIREKISGIRKYLALKRVLRRKDETQAIFAVSLLGILFTD
jgi:A/G-specific adenine glycosylase